VSRQLRPLTGTNVITSEASPGSASEVGDNSLVDEINENTREERQHPRGKCTTGIYHRKWKRRPSWMARAPFLTAAKHYLDDVRPFYRESTLIRKSRDLRTIYRDLQKLGIQTTPAKLKEEHIKALLMKWQERLEPASQEKLVTVLDGFLI